MAFEILYNKHKVSSHKVSSHWTTLSSEDIDLLGILMGRLCVMVRNVTFLKSTLVAPSLRFRAAVCVQSSTVQNRQRLGAGCRGDWTPGPVRTSQRAVLSPLQPVLGLLASLAFLLCKLLLYSPLRRGKVLVSSSETNASCEFPYFLLMTVVCVSQMK